MIFTVESKVTHKSLMNKSKWDLASLVLEQMDMNGELQDKLIAAEKSLATKITAEALKREEGE